jgi:hypothetical protein
MLGNSDETRPHDLVHIDVGQPDDLAYWTEVLGVDEPTLRGAIQAVGFTADDVRDYLKWREAATRAA